MTPLLSISEESKLLAVSKITVRRKVSPGSALHPLDQGGPMRFDMRDIEKFVSAEHRA